MIFACAFFSYAMAAVAVVADVTYPPCVFNPLCMCSRSDAHLAVVVCNGVPLAKLPTYLNRSKINNLQISDNGLRKIDEYFLSGSGLHVLKISRNPLHVCHENALKGLENSLRELELSYANLIEVPHRTLRQMQKLQTLSLAGNEIVDVSSENWITVRNTLETLNLRENSISHVPANAFAKFAKLKWLDLSKNVIFDMDPDTFFPETIKLSHLYLADNLLRFIPYAQIQQLRSLKVLDLSYNLISKLNSVSESTRTSVDTKFFLNTLHLEYNSMKYLTAEDFQKFDSINATYFDGNPITSIQPETFRSVRISELSFAGCGLIEFNARMIAGLEKSLSVLDVSNNNLLTLDPALFRSFTSLQELKALGNNIESFSVPDFIGSVLRVQIGGGPQINRQTVLRDLSKIKSLISISMQNVEVDDLVPDLFIGYGFGVEELNIVNANVRSIYPHAFVHVRGLKTIDLSNNELTHIYEDAFAEVGHALNYLYLTNAFAKSVKTFPQEPMKHLNSLRVIDISYNDFEELPVNSFHSMYNLEVARIHDCRIGVLKRETFGGDIHQRLREVTFAFNQLSIIKSYSFADLNELKYVNFEDNVIRSIETKAFVNLVSLRWIHLRGNQIEVVESDAFSNLPELELLDLAFNNLKNFDFSALDEMVGSLSYLALNLSFNDMHSLEGYVSEFDLRTPELNVKILDLSYNNISHVSHDYLAPLENSLTHLYLDHNKLTNISDDVFGSLHQLLWFDFSFNAIRSIEPDIFKRTEEIQVLNLHANRLRDIPANLFNSIKNLRVVDLSGNRLNYMPDFSFRDDSLERISLAGNSFVRIPYRLFTPEVVASLRELDLSYNSIGDLHSPELMAQFKSLQYLNISANKLSRLDMSTFYTLHNLLYLDVSHNEYLEFDETHAPLSTNFGANSLRFLSLKNISLNAVPHLPLPNLTHLSLSFNNLSAITPEPIMNLTSLRVLDLSRNNFDIIPVVVLSMKNLKMLNLSRNSINILTNNSVLSGFEELRELDISELPLHTFETGALSRLKSLRTLHLSAYENVIHFSVPKILKKNLALQNLYVDVHHTTLDDEMRGDFPKNLRNIVIHGSELENLGSDVLAGASFPRLAFSIRGTNVARLGDDLFARSTAVRNLSVDVRENHFERLLNPSTGEFVGLYGRSFLVDLKISSNAWNCRCEIGWVETWRRVHRQFLCRYVDLARSKTAHDCFGTDDDLRRTRCADGRSLVAVMREELECSFSRSSYSIGVRVEYVVALGVAWLCTFAVRLYA